MINLKQGDCLELLKNTKDSSFDLTVTSPPYDNLRTYKDSLEWGEHIWQPILEELFRTTKEGGVVVWVVGDATVKGSETGTSFKQALWAMQCGFNLHDTMIWAKDGGGAVGSQKCYTQNFEYMFILSKGKISTHNIIKDKTNGSYGVDKSGVGRRTPTGEHKIETRKPSKEFSRRNNWWYVPPVKGHDHPAIFPEKLAEDHIVTWSNEGDVVFDPFLGSGTTGAMAVKHNRGFVGFEKVPEFFQISKDRINKHLLGDLF
tara:strand:+ start:7834 stop:8610 length:777 start_codon:yes stop_codon:yes gene_type:complete